MEKHDPIMSENEHGKPKQNIYRLFDGLGLYIEIDPKGGKYWRLKYYYLGKERRLAIGKYPETSLLEARERRNEARKSFITDMKSSIVSLPMLQ